VSTTPLIENTFDIIVDILFLMRVV
jgi:hypothetical protein